MITRVVAVDARWDCISSKNYVSKPHLVNVRIRDTYRYRPTEDLDDWARRVANEVTKKMCERACGSLSDSVYCNDIYPDIGTPEETGKPEVPKSVLDQIEYMEKLYREAETTDEKDAIREEINRIKERYGIE